jgi:predicted DCC family thiol-disulfide oxidoreductase YuxK
MDERAGSDDRRPGGSGLLIFDGDCGFCTWAAEWAERRLPSDGRTRPWQLMEDELPSYGLTPERVSAAVYWVDPAGRPHRGHRGIARMLRTIGGAWAPLGTLMEAPVLSWLAAGAYRLVSRYRHLMPGTTPACERTPPD